MCTTYTAIYIINKLHFIICVLIYLNSCCKKREISHINRKFSFGKKQYYRLRGCDDITGMIVTVVTWGWKMAIME